MLYPLLFVLAWSCCLGGANVIRPKCPRSAKICEFDLTLSEKVTMMKYPDSGYGEPRPVTVLPNGTFYIQDDCGNPVPLGERDSQDVVIGDGSYKKALLFNGQLPGPAIVVYEGQQVVVRVTNKLPSAAITLHFHGLPQRLTPWMDGVPHLTQCPIVPGNTFEYRFLATPSGTFWYHTHLGTQRTMGAYGPLIILDESVDSQRKQRGRDPLPDFEAEFYLTLHDWMREDSSDIMSRVEMEAVSFSYGYSNKLCFNSTKEADGVDCGVTPFVSGIINGRGFHYDEFTGELENPGVPLEVFSVTKGKKYRFRGISGAMTFAFRLSIDQHPLHVIATDGSNVLTTVVESVIIYSGERYDFWIDAGDPDGLGEYWIRAQTLEAYLNGEPKSPGHVEAILRYDSPASSNPLPSNLPVSNRTRCTQTEPCKILNCPYRFGSLDGSSVCIPVSDLRIPFSTPTHSAPPGDFVEYFLNFHFAGWDTIQAWKPTINGIQHVFPRKPPLIYTDKESEKTPCNVTTCNADFCQCTHELRIPKGKVVQLVFFTTIKNEVGVLNGIPHNVHLHGDSFQVLKTAYPTYNASTLFYESKNQDIECTVNDLCNRAQWRNRSWANGNVEGITLESAPVKDTVVAPIGGYVVVRFKADNPGYWYMHCHTEFHAEERMSLYVRIGEDEEMYRPPERMKTCGDFDWTDQQFKEHMDNPITIGVASAPDVTCLVQSGDSFVYSAYGLGVATLFLAFFNMYLFCDSRRLVEYKAIQGRDSLF